MRISDWSSDVCSSDLGSRLVIKVGSKCDGKISKNDAAARPISHHCMPLGEAGNAVQQGPRSEEHTSELQSLMRISYAVFCLKKKKTKKQIEYTITYNQMINSIHITQYKKPKHI